MRIQLGADRDTVYLASRSRKGYWRMSSNSIVQSALNVQWLKDQGVISLADLWVAYNQEVSPKSPSDQNLTDTGASLFFGIAAYGAVRAVMWELRG